MSKALRVGTVWVNTCRAYSYVVSSGGMKRSGVGREQGMEAVDGYLETRSVVISADDETPPDIFVMR